MKASQMKASKREPAPAKRPLRLSFSLGSMLVIMVVVAFLGAILSQFFRWVADPSPANVGYFALAAAVGPSAILIAAGTVFKVLRWLKHQQSETTISPDL